MPLRRMPPLGSLRAFEAAARLSSFKKAAAELSVTPGAISQQIRTLEEDLGVKLFTRAVRRVVLTDPGRELQPALSAAFLQIREAVDRARPEAKAPLRVESTSAIISKWLLPKLHRFGERNPDLGVTIGTMNQIRPCAEREVFIRFSTTPGEGVFGLKLCDEFVLPLASPDLVERLDLRTPQDLHRAPLLHDMSLSVFQHAPAWPDWFAKAGLNGADAGRGMRFDRSSADHAIDAAVNGGGVVLARMVLARNDMLEGRLVCPFGPVLPIHISYFVVCRDGDQKRPDVAAFLDWAAEEAAAMTSGLEPADVTA